MFKKNRKNAMWINLNKNIHNKYQQHFKNSYCI